MENLRFLEKFRFIIVAAGALAIGGALASAPAQAAVQGGADAMRAASENGTLTEQTQFRLGGYDYCWSDDGWQGPGWYRCGFAYRTGLGWGGPIGWNNWRREFREHREFRDHDDRFRGRDRDDRFRDRDDRRRF